VSRFMHQLYPEAAAQGVRTNGATGSSDEAARVLPSVGQVIRGGADVSRGRVAGTEVLAVGDSHVVSGHP